MPPRRRAGLARGRTCPQGTAAGEKRTPRAPGTGSSSVRCNCVVGGHRVSPPLQTTCSGGNAFALSDSAPRPVQGAVIGALLDTILDRTVVAGYTSAGYRIRSRAWDAHDLPSMDGKTVLVTGAT